jgi:hypothetical protein
LQQAQISDDRVALFFPHVAESWHSALGNPIVNHIEQRLIRERPHRGPANDVRRMLTTEPVESMASRASQLENALSPEARLQAGSGPFVVRVLAKGTTDRTEKNQDQSNVGNDSPGHVTLLVSALAK